MPRLAVIGYPVGHSRSPAMQGAALEALGLAGEWSYGALELEPGEFAARVRELAAGGEYAGVNVTVPHKEAALALADEASAAAAAIGAANTLSFEAGRIAADNTDAAGLLAALGAATQAADEAGVGSAAEGTTGAGPGGGALVLGAGGAARAVVWALSGAAASISPRFPRLAVDVWNRTATRANELCAELGGEPLAAVRGTAVAGQASYGLIVNTTAVGLRGEDPFEQLPLDPDAFSGSQTVVDMVYGEGPGALLAAAAAAGARPVDGLEVLVQQGARSLAIWTGRDPDLAVMRAAARG